MTIYSRKIDDILEDGIFLGEFHINNWALTKSQAINILKKFEEEKIPVLGGDVLVYDGKSFSYNYDNWYCDKYSSENANQFTKRSIRIAIQYISEYAIEGVYFVLVPDI